MDEGPLTTGSLVVIVVSKGKENPALVLNALIIVLFLSHSFNCYYHGKYIIIKSTVHG